MGQWYISPMVKIGAMLSSQLINDERIAGVVTDYIPYTDVAVILFCIQSNINNPIKTGKGLDLGG